MNVLLLTESVNSDATGLLVQEFQNRKHIVTVVRPSDLHLYISDNPSGFDSIYRDKKGVISRILTTEFDVLYPRIGANLKFGAAIMQHFQKNVGVYSPISVEALLNASNKFQTQQLFSQFGIKTPRTLLSSDSGSIDQLLSKVGGIPVVLKQLYGSQGIGVSILDSKRAVKSTLESFSKAGITLLIQEYIPANGRDFRVFVVGNQVVAAYQRIAQRGEFRANISGGGKGVPAKITREEEKLSLLAAKAVGLSVAGIDFIRSKSGETFFVEANGNPGLHVQKVTGINVALAIVDFVEKDFEKHKNDHNRSQQERRETHQLLDDLENQAKKVSRMIDPITKNAYLTGILAQYRGQSLEYVDRFGQRQQKKLNTLTDLISVMTETFKIQ